MTVELQVPTSNVKLVVLVVAGTFPTLLCLFPALSSLRWLQLYVYCVPHRGQVRFFSSDNTTSHMTVTTGWLTSTINHFHDYSFQTQTNNTQRNNYLCVSPVIVTRDFANICSGHSCHICVTAVNFKLSKTPITFGCDSSVLTAGCCLLSC